ncbi:type I secretion system permease/ATPase [Ottowia testudinis]|uniref:Cyclolysin secretion/processing ATP-binding protein CyaB n=1 Tax=Ottowia testudinis TaxID=2816950 RepID=A0A975H3L1_9BURK|nr:type I secretion system permease/ATPase [Ottowia testudinis]QTD45390.1 type I secretion system permease/ATPase [Ottowia testudinis]
MSALFDQFALLTHLLGQPLSAHALASQTLRNAAGRIDMHSLGEVLRSHGYDNKLDERGLDDIPSLAAPLLLVTRDGAGVVVEAIGGAKGARHYTVRDVDGSRTVWDQATMQAHYIGFCWFLKARPQQDRRSELPEYTMGRAWFWKVIWRFKGYYVQVLIASVLINVLALIGSLYVMNVYDRVIPNRAYETLWVLSIGVLAANLFEFLARTIRARLTDVAGKKADLIISSALFRRVLAIDLAQKPASSGSYASNLRDFESVRDFMTSATLLALVDLPFVLLFIFVMWMVAGPLALVPLLTIPLVVLAGLIAQVPLAKYTNESMREGSQRQGLAVEAIEGLETLKTNNATNWAQQRWDRYTAATAASSMKLKDWSNVVVNFSMLVQQANTVVMVLWGTYLIHHENPAARITMGALIACVILAGRTLGPLSQVAGLMVRLQQARVAMKGIDGIVERKTERDNARSYVSLPHVEGELALSQMGYRYGPQGPLVLNGINLTLRPGEKVGILGRIGSGKSTLLRVMAGLYQPAEGHALLDKVDMRQIDPSDLRSHVSLLGQSPRIFLGTLRENLDMGRMDRLSNDAELLAALRRFGLDRIVQSHPLGLNMPIGEDGQGLSGGQKQIVGLARLTLRDPSIVLLDEPTSGLDPMTEQAALKAVADWAKNRTLVMVTHRMQVLPFVDRVIVIDQGRVVMDGPRDAVLRQLGANGGQAQAIGAAQQPPPGAAPGGGAQPQSPPPTPPAGPIQPHAAQPPAPGTMPARTNPAPPQPTVRIVRVGPPPGQPAPEGGAAPGAPVTGAHPPAQPMPPATPGQGDAYVA